MENLRAKLLQGRLPAKPPLGVGQHPTKKRRMLKRDYTPVKWDLYFDNTRNVHLNADDTFHIYESGTEGPLCVLLHGGGFSGLSWALLAKHLTGIVSCRCLAIDLRGHGETSTADETDFSINKQANDVSDVIKSLYGEDPPPILLIGHSMGGAVAVHTAHQGFITSLIGLIVIDVVEGTALEALSGMQSVLRGRPSQFKSLDYAIEWCCRTGYVHNIDSAKVSMIGQLKLKNSDEAATLSFEGDQSDEPCAPGHETISEENDETQESSKPTETQQSASIPTDIYTWRIDLFKTQPYWREWFEGLSGKFLSIGVPKLLLLAGVDRLDKDLTIGQMQGKFQMQVLPRCGHAVHEDVPDQVADVIATFMLRHKVATPKADFQKTFPAC